MCGWAHYTRRDATGERHGAELRETVTREARPVEPVLAHSMIVAVGGSQNVQSALAPGTRFGVELPIISGRVAATEREAATLQHPQN